MGFFGSPGDDTGGGRSPGAVPDWFDARRELSSIARGRLERTARSGVGASTLSAKEFALLGPLGLRPIGEVLGACAYRLGTQQLPPEAGYVGRDFSVPLRTLNDAWSHARRLAFERLEEEARALGADAVLGVQLQRGERGWTRRGIDVSVIGTAVRLPDGGARAGEPRDVLDVRPVLSDLSGQDYWTLRAAGCDPAGLVASTAVVFVSAGGGTRWRRLRTATQNQELVELSDGFSGARHMAVRDLAEQARRTGAEGVVGVSFDYDLREGEFAVDARGATAASSTSVFSTALLGGDGIPAVGGGDKRSGMVFTVHVAGTAIRRRLAAGTDRPPGEPSIRMVMRLGEG